ncbi:MAG: cell division protein ZapA [Ruminococcus sp.]|jgi:cell division protein ZapA|uniref:cell division protein ZapA n=1 Tax=Ruminococcus sp. JL13D9 TaxID=3233381 RepID=UPI0026FD6F1E|nr:cell division protein ZapA [Ruminococcus sp.]MDO4882787.1 cell division protein ZapA [Oscillospiraceae bacterium]
MEKKRISVLLEGRSYVVITTESEEYVKKVANDVSAAILNASRSAQQLDVRDCAILAAMDFCDDKNKAVKRNKDLVQKADQFIKKNNDLNRQVVEYREKLTDAINENTALVKRVKALEDQLASLTKENDRLKRSGESKKSDKKYENEKKFEKAVNEKKNEKIMGYVPMRQGSLFDDDKNKK